MLTVLRERADRILLSQERTENVPVEHQEEKQEETAFSNVPVYAKSLSEARELNELDIYRASRNENHACANMTDAFISKHYNDNSLDSEVVLNDLLESILLNALHLFLPLILPTEAGTDVYPMKTGLGQRFFLKIIPMM